MIVDSSGVDLSSIPKSSQENKEEATCSVRGKDSLCDSV